MQTADDRDVLDQLESDLLAVESALAELDRLGETVVVGPGDVNSGKPGVEAGRDGHGDRGAAIRAVVADRRFVTDSGSGDPVVTDAQDGPDPSFHRDSFSDPR